MKTKPTRFVALGHGFSGGYDTREEAQAVINTNRNGTIYRLEQPVPLKSIRELREKASCGAMGIGDVIDLIDEIERLSLENADLRKTC